MSSSAFFFSPFLCAASGCDAETLVVGCTVTATDEEGAGPDAVGVVVEVSFLTKTVTSPALKTAMIVSARNLWKPFRSAPLESQQRKSTYRSGKDGQRQSG